MKHGEQRIRELELAGAGVRNMTKKLGTSPGVEGALLSALGV